GILDLSRAYRLKPGTGWLVPPCVLHAPGSMLTFEPQWGSDVFAMYQSMVEGRYVPWDLLIKDVPPQHARDLDYLVEILDWEQNVDPEFKAHHYLEPIPAEATASEGYEDRWVVYGKVNGEDLFSAKELTVQPGARLTLKENRASGMIVVQGRGRIGKLRLDCPAYIRFGDLTDDEVFITEEAARQGVEIACDGPDALVTLRYFGPGMAPDAPAVGAHRA